MNVKSVSRFMSGTALIAGLAMLSGCNNIGTANKLKEQAVKYLNEKEVLKANKMASKQTIDNMFDSKRVAYWDSLLIEAKALQAYYEGQHSVRDSIDNIPYVKPDYKPNLDTLISSGTSYNLIKGIKDELSYYVSGQEMAQYIQEEPKINRLKYFGRMDNSPFTVHYWGLIAAKGRENEAFEKGAADERARINKTRTIEE